MSKQTRRSRKAESQQFLQQSNETLKSSNYQPKFSNLKKAVNIVPRNVKQEEYLEYLSDDNRKLIVASGAAGTGKTSLAVMAGIKQLSEKKISKIVLSRPAVGVENEDHGFLPGTIYDKMLPWVMPLMDVLEQYYSQKEITALLENKVICIEPLMYLRGRNLEKSWIIFDEAQNSTMNQMKMILTRLCEGSKIIITGDPNQKDKQFRYDNGLDDLMNKIDKSESKLFGMVKFENKDIVRSELVKEILAMYDEE
jgi:phosphate starvation-inducible PhoH-like protein